MKKTVFTVIASLLLVSLAFSDTLVLIGGGKIEGEITNATDKAVTILTGGAEMAMPVSRIHKTIIKGKENIYNPLENAPKKKTPVKKTSVKVNRSEPAADPEKEAMKKLTSRVQLPKPESNSAGVNNLWAPSKGARLNKTGMEKSAGRYLFLVQKGTDPASFWRLNLGIYLACLDYDAGAYQQLDPLTKPGADLVPPSRIKWLAGSDTIKTIAHLYRARILAKHGARKEMEKEIAACALDNGYKHLLAGEAYALAGEADKSAAELKKAVQNTSGHPEGNWGRTFTPMRACSIAHLAGKNSEAVELGKPLVGRGQNAEKWPMYKAAWALANTFTEYAKAGRNVDYSKLKDGVFTGSAQGYEAPVDVAVTVSRGRIVKVDIKNQRETRPYSALEIIPQRIVEYQSLNVDTISSATISSLAVIGGAEEALLKASE